MKTYLSRSVEETEAFAAEFAKTLSAGLIVAFQGGMGMGKTAFIRGMVRGLGGGEVVSSPTFALINEYETPRFPVCHFDMYRVTTWDDLYSTGFFDYLDSGALLLIEWSENISGPLPEHIITVTLSQGAEENQRVIAIEGEGAL